MIKDDTSSARLAILRTAHDDLAHKGFFATAALISERFWWPAMRADIAWFLRTCQPCQLRQVRNVLIPPVVAMPSPIMPSFESYVAKQPSLSVIGCLRILYVAGVLSPRSSRTMVHPS